MCKVLKDPTKAVRGVDFTKYALSVIIQTSYLKNYITLVVLILLSLLSHHMCIVCWSRYGENMNITKTYLYNFDPLKPHFYIVKLGFSGVYIIFLISAQNRGGSNEYPPSMF